MAVSIPRVAATVPALNLEDRKPAIGDRQKFTDDTVSVYAELEDWGPVTSDFSTQANATATAMNGAADTAGLPASADATGVVRGSVEYFYEIDSTPISAADVAAARKMSVAGLDEYVDRPTLDWFIAEEGPDGPRWAGPIVSSATTSTRLAFANSTGTLSVALVTADGADYTVTLDDGRSLTVASASTATFSYPGSGYADIVSSTLSEFTQINSADGGWSFDVAALPRSLVRMTIDGTNTISGTVANLPAGLVHIVVLGSNTLTGDISALPSGLTYINIGGANALSGDVAGLPPNVALAHITGNNAVSGDIDDFPASLINVAIHGANTVTGDIVDINAGTTYFNIVGNNTLSGNISAFNSGSFTYVRIDGGSSTITGDLSVVAPSIRTLWFNSDVSTIAIPSDPTFPSTMDKVFFLQSTLTQAELTRFLSGLSEVTAWEGVKQVNVAGSNAALNAAGIIERDQLVAKGVTVYHN